MEHFERAWHEKRGLAACRRSDNQHDCQHGQGKTHQHGNPTEICNALNCDISDVIELEQDESTAEKG